MQVAHHKDHITHAVIGGGETVDFRISSSAEFFNILSTTLYKDQKLAVVRETLCNAWDAHIEAGITDRPIEITLTNDKFVIRDFGTGIHKDDMGPIYGTYGGSTKKNDGQQTGGFGLGCKAPFAYTDHFEVQSSHDGIRTIYNMSKSSAAAMGKPGIVPIVSFPTEESGLQVTIELKKGDMQAFRQLVQRIASNGDMKLTLNGSEVEPIGFDLAKSNFLVLTENPLGTNHRVMIRYGNVIYPVDRSTDIASTYDKVMAHLNRISHYSQQYSIIFQAPAHTISVTPSRESLSMQEHTINTLNVLFGDFMSTVNGRFRPECGVQAERYIEQAVLLKDVPALLNREAKLPADTDKVFRHRLTDLVDMAAAFVEKNYPEGHAFRKRDITMRLQGLVDGGLLDRGMVQSYLRELNRGDVNQQPDAPWFQRRYLAPLVSKMASAGINVNSLFVCDDRGAKVRSSYAYHGEEPNMKATNASLPDMYHALPYFRNVLVLTTSYRGVMEQVRRDDAFDELGRGFGFLFYKVSPGKKRKDEIEFFMNCGMTVINAIPEASTRPRAAPVARPKKPKGLPALKCIRLSDGTLNKKMLENFGVEHIEKPEFVIPTTLRKEDSLESFDGWTAEQSALIVELFGARGAIINNTAKAEKAKKEGAKSLSQFLVDEVSAFMTTNKNVQAFWAYQPDRVIEHFNIFRNEEVALMRLIYGDVGLRKKFKLVNTLSPLELQMVQMWVAIEGRWRHAWSDKQREVRKLLDAIPVDPANHEVAKLFSGSHPLMKILDKDELGTQFVRARKSPALFSQLVSIMTLVFK